MPSIGLEVIFRIHKSVVLPKKTPPFKFKSTNNALNLAATDVCFIHFVWRYLFLVYQYRWLLSDCISESRHYRQVTSVPLQIVTHDGTDVPIYSRGPMSHLLHSTHEQHYIYHVITYAACLGSYRGERHCNDHVYAKYTNTQAYLRGYHLTSDATASYPLQNLFRHVLLDIFILLSIISISSR